MEEFDDEVESEVPRKTVYFDALEWSRLLEMLECAGPLPFFVAEFRDRLPKCVARDGKTAVHLDAFEWSGLAEIVDYEEWPERFHLLREKFVGPPPPQPNPSGLVA